MKRKASYRAAAAPAAALLLSLLATLWIYAGPVAVEGGHWWSRVRNYGFGDQVSAQAIAQNVVSGLPSLAEPFTATGHLYWPSGYYQVIGHVAKTLGWSVPTTVTACGLLTISVMVIVLGMLAYRLSGRRWWSPILVIVPSCLGTFSQVTGHSWFNPVNDSVLWGPFGPLYALAGETAALATVILSGSILIAAVCRGIERKGSRALILAAGLCLGLTAELHAYPFICGAALLVLGVAGAGLALAPTQRRLALTAAGLVAMFVIGPLIRHTVGPLEAFVVLLLPAGPGLAIVVRRHPRLVLSTVGVVVVAALPELIYLAIGYARHDPFLEFRQNASGRVTVPFLSSLQSSLPLLAIATAVVWRAWQRGHLPVVGAVTAMIACVYLLGGNQAWGLGQEPNRMWIDSVTIVAFLLVPLAAWTYGARAPSTARKPMSRRATLAALSAALIVYGLGTADVVKFWTSVRADGSFAAFTPDTAALQRATAQVDGVIGFDPCADPIIGKLATGRRVAWYNAGQSWPANKGTIQAFLDQRNSGKLDVAALRAGVLSAIVTKDSCAAAWPTRYAHDLQQITHVAFWTGASTDGYAVWNLRPAAAGKSEAGSRP